ncbi:MAG: hypothetical protein OXI95_04970 [bacterium]|nr:hypothetical protein [bacterium]MDE0416274.1 hypothetical protein [bacterium]
MRQFIILEREFAHDCSLDNEHERLRIEAMEPSVVSFLDVMCHYELLWSLGEVRKLPRIPWHGGEPAETDILRLSESWPGLDLSEVAVEFESPSEPRLECIQRSGKTCWRG